MALVLKITVSQTPTGVNTNISCAGMCTDDEADMAEFIHNAVVMALKARPGFDTTGKEECIAIDVVTSNNQNEGKNNVH